MALERCWMDGKQTRSRPRGDHPLHEAPAVRCGSASFPHKIFTKKPLETRMGKGKARARRSWVAVIRPANVLFEVDGVTEADARESMRLAATKLPINTKFIVASPTRELE
jgi:large subunit ribosomal protein L16